MLRAEHCASSGQAMNGVRFNEGTRKGPGHYPVHDPRKFMLRHLQETRRMQLNHSVQKAKPGRKDPGIHGYRYSHSGSALTARETHVGGYETKMGLPRGTKALTTTTSTTSPCTCLISCGCIRPWESRWVWAGQQSDNGNSDGLTMVRYRRCCCYSVSRENSVKRWIPTISTRGVIES
jgi:hypothetical protein